jgi:hypothetical protein
VAVEPPLCCSLAVREASPSPSAAWELVFVENLPKLRDLFFSASSIFKLLFSHLKSSIFSGYKPKILLLKLTDSFYYNIFIFSVYSYFKFKV